jgi:cytochrome c biogenesis protein CcdA
LGIVLGFIISFTFFTLFLSTIVRISGIQADSIRLFSVIVIALFGLSLLIPSFQILSEKLFSHLAKFMPKSQNRNGFGGGLIIGMSIGLLWTPCVGPILASVISLAITGTVTLDTFFITLAYSLGTAIPMFLIILGGQQSLKKVPWLLRNLGTVQKIFGIIMIVTAIGIYFGMDRMFQTYILETFPQYEENVIMIENNEHVQEELESKLK